MASTRCGFLFNERISWTVHVDKYRTKEVADFLGLDCSTISISTNRTAEARKQW